ncbi:hypothetical protein DPMN_133375 [Dreissena polymorpha]|uniref:Uncharacterized protein n=1 Tax=Dreissena polymorpha TaxID=45954 RepID=A0A9D4FXS1_DREPO|nr:hypothetical protein DPMN_133375 [Dreissena polymorpha]
MDNTGNKRTPFENWTLPQNVTRTPDDDANVVGIELFLVPVIALFGIPGNEFSCAIFSTKPLNKNAFPVDVQELIGHWISGHAFVNLGFFRF